MVRIWVADDEPNEWLSLYARGNTGEVFPNVVSALTGTMIGEPIAQAQAEIFVESGILRPDEGQGPSCGTGVFGGYLYLNASAFRLFGVRTPGLSWRDVDEQALGEVTDLPDYQRAKGDRNLAASWEITRYSIKLLRRPDLRFLDEARADAHQWLESIPDLDLATDGDLLAWLATFPPRQKASMKLLSRATTMVGAPRGMLDQLLARAKAPPGMANRIVGGTGDIDSARLAQRLWTLGRLVADDELLTNTFDEGLEGIAERTRSTPLQAAVDLFLDEHGHRGNDEYELATLPWGMDSSPVYAAIDRLRRAPADRDPAVAGRRLTTEAGDALAQASMLVPRPLRRILRRMADIARSGSIARERAKDILVLENLGARRVLHELVRRAAERGGPTDPRQAFCVTYDELADFVADPAAFDQVITERAARRDYLNARIPPPWFKAKIPDPSTWQLRSETNSAAPHKGSRLEGIGVAGGRASGAARVITNPGDPRGLEPGDVLVCPITDPSWTPLFLSAVAVVCETGAIQSHAAIVARELGIPAVLSVPAIMGVVDGTMLEVDGDAGTVHITS